MRSEAGSPWAKHFLSLSEPQHRFKVPANAMRRQDLIDWYTGFDMLFERAAAP